MDANTDEITNGDRKGELVRSSNLVLCSVTVSDGKRISDPSVALAWKRSCPSPKPCI